MYSELIDSDARPFRATPDARFYFAHSSIESARQTAVRAISRAEGPVMILGAAGLGKSLLGELLAVELGQQFDLVKLQAARLCSRRALLQNILFELQMPYRELSEGELRLSLLDRLEPGEHCAENGALFIVDEAHTLPEKLLEELRLITNFTRNQQPRARLVLLGNMQLEDVFSRPRMESFNQRLAARCYLSPMTRDETLSYVGHQLSVAGQNPDELVSWEAKEALHQASEGVPRLANQIMDHALVIGLTREECPITAHTIEEAWADLQQLPLPFLSAADRQDELLKAAPVEFGSLDDGDVDSDEPPAEGVTEIESDPVTAFYEFGPANETDEGEVGLDEESNDIEDSQDVGENLFEQVAVDEEFNNLEEVEHSDALEISDSEPETDAAVHDSSGEVTHETQAEDIEPLGQADELNEAIEISPAQDAEIGSNAAFDGGFFAAFADPSSADLPPELKQALDTPSSLETATDEPAVDDTAVNSESDEHALSSEADADVGLEADLEDEKETGPAVELDAILQTPAHPVATDGLERPQFAVSNDQPLEEADETVLPQDSFFQDKPTDEKLIALREEQREFEEMQLWDSAENKPQLNVLREEASQAQEFVAAPVSITNPSTEMLFGADFDEEYGIEEIPEDRSEVIAVGTADNVAEDQIESVEAMPEADDTASVPAAAEILRVVEELPAAQTPAVEETPASVEQGRVEETSEPAAPAAADPWCIDVSSTDASMELALHSDIEEIVSQLNFAAFTEESFTVEQVSHPNGRQPLAKGPHALPQENGEVEDSVRYGPDSEFYTMHKGEQVSPEEAQDDDRDMLIIEEDIQPQAEAEREEAPRRVAPYTQLFAKLRK